ncbi:MAG: ATP-binding cassette domain-containing protein [Nanoarchaeota archaeon]
MKTIKSANTKAKEIIKLKDVSKHYYLGGEIIKAVDEINITINKGEFIAIVGPSGSGKSTMMNLIGALDLATKGEIYLDGINIEILSESELALLRSRKIGFVFQTFNLIPTLTALENVMLPMIFRGISLSYRKEKAKELGLIEENYYIETFLSVITLILAFILYRIWKTSKRKNIINDFK